MRRSRKDRTWKIELSLVLIVLTAVFYTLRWVLFPQAALHRELERYFVGDLAFLCLQVLVVTVFLESFMARREREAVRRKLNMIVGAFFSNAGYDLLARIAEIDGNLPRCATCIVLDADWEKTDFDAARAFFTAYRPALHPTPRTFEEFKELFDEKKDYILTLLSNQSLMDHETFTDLLWAASHLADELDARRHFDRLPEADFAHLIEDLERIYTTLCIEWVTYLKYLGESYPYLYSLAVRKDPFACGPCSPIIEDEDTPATPPLPASEA